MQDDIIAYEYLSIQACEINNKAALALMQCCCYHREHALISVVYNAVAIVVADIHCYYYHY